MSLHVYFQPRITDYKSGKANWNPDLLPLIQKRKHIFLLQINRHCHTSFPLPVMILPNLETFATLQRNLVMFSNPVEIQAIVPMILVVLMDILAYVNLVIMALIASLIFDCVNRILVSIMVRVYLIIQNEGLFYFRHLQGIE